MSTHTTNNINNSLLSHGAESFCSFIHCPPYNSGMNNPNNYNDSCSCGNACSNNGTGFCEYGNKANGCIREKQPSCPYLAVIPFVTVEKVSNVRNLADCFVRVAEINTVFYIDDKHRPLLVWAGQIEKNDYDYKANPLNVRSQTVYDFKNNRAIYYNAQGEYRITTLKAA